MRLNAQLQKAKTNKDIKDAYMQALALNENSKSPSYIKTDDIWLVLKNNNNQSISVMLTQLLYYVRVALSNGETIPPLLAVADIEKAALLKSTDVLPFLANKSIKWGKTASQYPPETLSEISAYIRAHFVSFKIASHEDEFISTVKTAIKSGDIIQRPITPENLKQVFDKWVGMIGREIVGVTKENYVPLFYADIMQGVAVSTNINSPAVDKNEDLIFSLNGSNYALSHKAAYYHFWTIYQRPPKTECQHFLLERRDSLTHPAERSFKGAFYTPLAVVNFAYDLLFETLGKNWQEDYIVWDMCCGVGNLEIIHGKLSNIYMSTLEQSDVDLMRFTNTLVAAHRFQYDYLNDDLSDDGKIDYSLSDKVPVGLRQAISNRKKILVLINPPYAEVGSGVDSGNKPGVSATQMSKSMHNFGFPRRELFAQFMVRIAKEMPTATLAIFSTMKYINAPNFEKFRTHWNAQYLNGFVVHSQAFDGLNGNFPIGFLIWAMKPVAEKKIPITTINTTVLDKTLQPLGEKTFYSLPNREHLNSWMLRLTTDSFNIPLKSAFHPQTAHAKVFTWRKDAIAYFLCKGGDVQNANQTALFSSVYSNGCGFYVTAENLWQTAVMFTMRRVIKKSWLNDRDQYLRPNRPLTDEFKNDCLVWMLFSCCNLTAGANELEWDKNSWSLVNHFIPFTESEVGATERFESDFMVQYMADRKYSTESSLVLAAGLVLWQTYFSSIDEHIVRDQLKLNRPDVGWYQIRNALKLRNDSSGTIHLNFRDFEAAYKSLSKKLKPQVYELGFLR